MRYYRILAALVVASLASLGAKPAAASFSVTLTDNNANTQTFGAAYIDVNGKIQITYADLNAGLKADFGNFSLTADPTQSTPGQAILQTTQIQLSVSGILTSLHVVISDDFNTPVGPLLNVENSLNFNTVATQSGTIVGDQSTLIATGMNPAVNVTGPAKTTPFSIGMTNYPAQLPTLTGSINSSPEKPFLATGGSIGSITPNSPAPPPFTMITDLVLTFSGNPYQGNITSSSSASGTPGATVPEAGSILIFGGLLMAAAIGAKLRGA